jgi:hypothetical protein
MKKKNLARTTLTELALWSVESAFSVARVEYGKSSGVRVCSAMRVAADSEYPVQTINTFQIHFLWHTSLLLLSRVFFCNDNTSPKVKVKVVRMCSTPLSLLRPHMHAMAWKHHPPRPYHMSPIVYDRPRVLLKGCLLDTCFWCFRPYSRLSCGLTPAHFQVNFLYNLYIILSIF